MLLRRFLLGLVVLAGLARIAHLVQWLIPLYVLGSLTLVSITPWPIQFPQYLAPLTPFLGLAVGGTLGRLSAGRSRLGPALRWATATLALLAVVMQVQRLIVLYTRDLEVAEWVDQSGSRATGRFVYYGWAEQSFNESLGWLTVHSAQGVAVAPSAPHVAFLRTGRKAIMPPMESSPFEAQRLLDSVPVDHLIVDDLGFVDISRRYGKPVVLSHPALWKLVGPRKHGHRVSKPSVVILASGLSGTGTAYAPGRSGGPLPDTPSRAGSTCQLSTSGLVCAKRILARANRVEMTPSESGLAITAILVHRGELGPHIGLDMTSRSISESEAHCFRPGLPPPTAGSEEADDRPKLAVGRSGARSAVDPRSHPRSRSVPAA